MSSFSSGNKRSNMSGNKVTDHVDHIEDEGNSKDNPAFEDIHSTLGNIELMASL